jgi:serine/tyrosine/threonine adenylyltransferase
MMYASPLFHIFTGLNIFCPRIYACRHLLRALSPLIGAESVLGNKAVGPRWAHGASDETIEEWGKKGTQSVKEEMEVLIQETCSAEYGRLMRKVSRQNY